MKKLVWLLVLALLVVPAFAANVSTSSWIGVGFHTRFLPFDDGYGLAWGTWGSGNLTFSLSGSSNLGSVNATFKVNLPSDFSESAAPTGTITFSKVAGLLDISFCKGTLPDISTILVEDILPDTGINVVLSQAPVKVTVGYAPANTWGKSNFWTDAALAVKGEVSVAQPVSVSAYGLIEKNTATGTITAWAVGGSVTPVTTPVSLTVYGEAASDPEQLVGATVKALGGKVTVDGNYKLQAQTVKLSVTADGVVPNVKAYAEYNTAETYTIFAYVSGSAPVPVGSLSYGAAVANGPDTLFGGFGKWSVSFGGNVSHDLTLGYGFDMDDYGNNGWQRGVLTGADNLWGVDVRGKFFAESKLMIGF
ncbi:hypothetical protein FY122_01580 [Dictyoglomus thermophilum]|uniref:hypothetical protein n=1 Tax=Dictyoglomus thermophilum TaxID=14 RepID=UPI0011EB1C67|nr:hypothetical protein [Dictyoglomus thermophilum]TYT24259.1 hypothetical protein FY122_01580 [Dictyoglomus thermophilum]